MIYPTDIVRIMRAAIVVTDPSDWTAQALLYSFTRKGIKADFLNFKDLIGCIKRRPSFLCAGRDLEELDVILVRDLGRSGASDVAFRFETLMALQERGVDVINPPQAIARAANKFATSLALQRAGVPTPRTAVTTSLEEAQAVLQNLGRAVSKPLFGFKGREIFLLQDGVQADLDRLESILNMEGLVYLQEFIAMERPRDIRAFVVDGAVLGAIYRHAPAGQWISNLARGGHPAACPITSELGDLAGRAAEAVGAVYCGVDLLETAVGLRVIEVNGTPSAKGIFQALGLDATAAIAEHVYQNCYLRGR
ncbi:MAG TPA: RimK family alpha-L-glutamate ligase [Methanothrix sp.]|nr:RimK family alpha-L-glutamate ligase [Methanothrix sp.]